MIDISKITEKSTMLTCQSDIIIGTKQKELDRESNMYMERLKELLEQCLKNDVAIKTENPKRTDMQLTYKPCKEDVWVQIYCKQSDDDVYGTARNHIAKSYFMCNRGFILDMKPSQIQKPFRLLAVSKANDRLQYRIRIAGRNKSNSMSDTFLAAITFGAYCTDEAKEVIRAKGLDATGSDKKDLEHEQNHIQVHHKNAYENTKGFSLEETLAFDCDISNIECITLPEHELAHTNIDINQDDIAAQENYARKSSNTHSGKIPCEDDKVQVTINAEVAGGREIITLQLPDKDLNSEINDYLSKNNFILSPLMNKN